MDRQPFGDDLSHSHTRRQRSIRILEYDLHVCSQGTHLLLVQLLDVIPKKLNRALRLN